MKCITLLTVLVLVMLAVCARAGKVTINGACVDCNTSTRKPSTAKGRHPPTPKPKSAKADDSDESDMSNWALDQDAHGGQHISRRHKRQRQIIITDGYNGGGGNGGGGGGWQGGRVTTIDSRGYPGTVVRNDDCVGCNIRG